MVLKPIKKLRELGCDKPIYALTANAMSHEIAEYLALGFNGHLKKPIERTEFIDIIAKYYAPISENEPNDKEIRSDY